MNEASLACQQELNLHGLNKYALRSPLMRMSRSQSSTPRSSRRRRVQVLELSNSDPGPAPNSDEEEDFRFLDNFVEKMNISCVPSLSPNQQKEQDKPRKTRLFPRQLSIKSPNCLRKFGRRDSLKKTSPSGSSLQVNQHDFVQYSRSTSIETSPVSSCRSEHRNPSGSSTCSSFTFDLCTESPPSSSTAGREPTLAATAAVAEAMAAEEEERRLASTITDNINKLKRLGQEFSFLDTTDLKAILEEERRLTEQHRLAVSSGSGGAEEVKRACIASLDFMSAVSELSSALQLEESRVLHLVGDIQSESNFFFSKVHPRAVAKLRQATQQQLKAI